MDSPEEICIVSSHSDEFQICKQTLLEHSDFFAALFNSGMKESQEKRIDLPTLSSAALQSAVEYMQNGSIKCALDSIPDILEVCTYLQMGKLTNFCVHELEGILSCDTCFNILGLGNQFMLLQLKNLAIGYIQDNFGVITKKEAEFAAINQEDMVKLLQSKLSVVSEIEVFDAAYKWLVRNHITEPCIVNKLFSCVRFPLMNETELNKCLQELQSFHVDIVEVFSDIATAQEILTDPLLIVRKYMGEKVLPRRLSRCILKLGGLTQSSGCTNRMMVTPITEICDSETDSVTWRYCTPRKGSPKLPTQLCEQSSALLGPFLYVAGGQTQYSVGGRHITGKVHRYDTRLNKWTPVCPMETCRCLLYLGAVNNCLYAVAGNVSPGRATPTVEQYNPHDNTWSYVSSLEIGLSELAGCCHDGNIYISGGCRGSQLGYVNRMWSYNPDTDTWSEKCRMTYSRSYHCMVSNRERIFVMGGVNYVGDVFEDIKSCEMYCPSSDQWTILCQLPRFASCITYHEIDNKIYLFGGHSFADNSDHQYVQIYDIATAEWTEKELNDKNIYYYAAIETDLPENFVSMFNR